MNFDRIKEEIYRELINIGMPTDVDIVIKGYSKSDYGNYNPNLKRITLFILDENGEIYPKREYMDTVIHEMVHHYQWNHTVYRRIKGIMHNAEFYKLFNTYYKLWEDLYAKNDVSETKRKYKRLG